MLASLLSITRLASITPFWKLSSILFELSMVLVKIVWEDNIGRARGRLAFNTRSYVKGN